jgi:RNA polymerase sigma factor (sigma-70 family)
MLNKYASRLLHNRTKYQFARHMQGCDIVSDIKLKLISREFKWDNNKSTLICFFHDRIRAEIANLVKKEKRFIPIPLHQPDSIDDDGFDNDNNVLLDPRLTHNPFESKINEDNLDLEDIKNIASDIFKNSEEEYCVADNMLKGLKSREIAEDLGITSNNVHNIKRRVIRKLRSFKQRFTDTDKPSDNSIRNKKPGSSTPVLKNNGDLK